MKRDLEIWRFAAERLKQNESAMLLIVAESAGSSPGRQGFKMIVAEDDLRGSIGGGVMEVRLVEIAELKIKDEELKIDSEIVEQIHRKNSQNPSGMICSGRQTIIFYRLDSSNLKTVDAIVGALENPQSKQSKILRVTRSELQVVENRSDDFDFKFEREGENSFLYEEKLNFKNKLSIVGGGHCALALSELMSKMDFYISLFDDRPNLNTFDENSFAHAKKIVESYENIGDFVASGANHFVVVMTLGFKSDEIVVRKLIDKNFRYFGVLGSCAKMAAMLKNLRREGFPKEKLDKIRAPVGLPINSRTPEEIAVSIAAEIVAVKNAKN